MSRRNKLQKFAELLGFPNVYENFSVTEPQLTGLHGRPVDLRARWAEAHFGNSHPITLELACGRGEYTLGLARLFPGRNFIGVDIKGARIWKGARTALEEGLSNAAFLRCRIEILDRFFGTAEVDSIWITFPDPFLRRSKANRRLTAPRFLDIYRKVLQPGGEVHLKTDEPQLYTFSKEVLASDPRARILEDCPNVYGACKARPELELKTYYERQHLAAGRRIRYLRFTLG